jgi:hypothetical protein
VGKPHGASNRVGRKPYGYRTGEAEVIARIKQLPNDGWVLEKIADSAQCGSDSATAPASSGRLATIRKTPNPAVTSSDQPAHRPLAHSLAAQRKVKRKC